VGKIVGQLGMPLSLEDQIQQLGVQIQALEVELAKRTEDSVNATRNANLSEAKLNEITTKYKEEQELKLAITKDMTRQYKMMQHDLIGRLSIKERKIQELMDEIQKLKSQHDADLQSKEIALHETTLKRNILERKLEELCEMFLNMLSSIYDNLVQKVDIQLRHDKTEKVSIKKRMEECRCLK
jgi:hypothetical protein